MFNMKIRASFVIVLEFGICKILAILNSYRRSGGQDPRNAMQRIMQGQVDKNLP